MRRQLLTTYAYGRLSLLAAALVLVMYSQLSACGTPEEDNDPLSSPADTAMSAPTP